ncbi:beta-N-acetylhexosaminidase [Paenibacillus sp. Root444D2]|uniref:beta-N-acetylhexosaminidase n=1 Tax=Paenibacillus sp. Root444D2 TaxID=1736538 RepID=UPI00070B546E|nr:beta-N-acetylhexosaminidase [Paenibacillus sp. Root444D2]KQX46641.1 glycoside hydrolase [Paenibacillus sp. Root444D2]
MKLHLEGDLQGLEAGLSVVSMELGCTLRPDGLVIQVVRSDDNQLEAGFKDGKGWIRYKEPIHFFRAFGLWIQHYESRTNFHLTEHIQFDTNGVMVDVSRNAVLTVGSVETMLRKMALMGLNRLMLYTEDTFAVEPYPYFGYMRGRFSAEQLKACDDYAFSLGIELVPCIQTLAHLTEALKWNYAGDIRDTSDILLVGSEKTYTFIRHLIEAAVAPFRSKNIHIGMDEAHQLGLGRYLEQNGYRKRFDIMNEHLKQVVEICEEFELSPMIWSDMYFRLGSKTGNYYDLNGQIPSEVIADMPTNVQYVYWDYYHDDEAFYRTFIEKHRAFGSDPVFAGGIWTWGSVAPNYGKTMATTLAALNACKSEGVREVFATMWGDNGAETSVFTGLAGMQLFAEHGYSEKVDEAKLAERFAFCTGGNWDDFIALNAFDETPGISKNNMQESNPSKFLLWQDVLIGLYDSNVQGLPLSGHYADLQLKMSAAVGRNGDWGRLFVFYEQLAGVLRVKCDMGIRLKSAYDANDLEQLGRIESEINNLRSDVDHLRKCHRTIWLAENTPFGWEVIDIRYGGVLSRLETAQQRIQDYLSGSVSQLEELEEQRLFFDAPWVMREGTLGRGSYHRIVTAGTFSG